MERDEQPTAPRRPLLAAALALAGGSRLGLAAGLGEHGLAGCAALGLAALAVRRRRAGHRGPPAWCVALALLAAARGLLAAGAVAPHPVAPAALAAARAELGALRERVLIGRFFPWSGAGPGHGWLAPAAGTPARTAHLVLALDGPAPARGAWVAVLPGGEVLPWPRGPVAGPLGRARRWLGVSRVQADELVRLAPPAPPGALARAASALVATARARVPALEGRLARSGTRQTALLDALLFGDRAGLDGATLDLFTRTGTRHLLALSGLHVGLFALLVLRPLVALVARLARGLGAASGAWVATALAIACALAYALLAGASRPVGRATVAFAAALLAPRFATPARVGRRADALSVWALALLLECLFDPTATLSLALQLSYGATLGLLVGAGPLARALLRPRGAGAELPVTRSAAARWTRAAGARVGRAFVQGVAASAAAVLATLPFAWSAFGEWSPAGIVATPLVLPLLVALLAFGWAALLAPQLVPAAALDLPAGLVLALLEAVDRLPATPAPLFERPALLVGAASAGALALAARRPALRGLDLAVRGAAALLFLPWSAAPARLEVHALDVGHGTCVVARAPGLSALVFDAGSRDRPRVFEEALAPLLARWEVARPWVAVSHDHADHRSALPKLRSRYPPRAWLGVGAAHPSERSPHTLDLAGGRAELGRPGRGPLRLALLRAGPWAGNEGSRSLELRVGEARVLLSGDAEGRGLAALLGLVRAPLRLLLAPHHGSETPLLGALLAGARPAEVWISTGVAPPILPELERRALAARWTGRDGPLALFLPEAGISSGVSARSSERGASPDRPGASKR